MVVKINPTSSAPQTVLATLFQRLVSLPPPLPLPLQSLTVQQCHTHTSTGRGEPSSVTIAPHTTALCELREREREYLSS